ncbi:dithiol-disulfide isomerase [Fusarium denticulatum]|uniref:Dithiol-disulfide isomerase n=1 Tax=Fusarium denticulatum TaxID=48507 RepID=A0A8H5T733_9HYPO|nr:dithiol-disulfide isomerase [Fusarium denticulatum]
MLIDIVIHGDILCPWCFLQKKTLEEAMERYQALHPEVEFDVTWKPFLLYPTLRRGDKRALYEKLMSPEKLRLFTSRLQTAGARYGIEFSVTGKTGPSQSAHRLVALTLETRGANVQSAFLDALFRGHFENGADVADEAWLMHIGRTEAKLEDSDMRAALLGPGLGKTLEDEVRTAAIAGVEAVPCVTVQKKYRVGGYQESDIFESLFDKIRRENR